MAVEKIDIYFWGIFVGLALIGYLAYIVVNPTYEILEGQDEVLEFAISQNDEIINNTNRNAEILAAYVNESIKNQDENLLFLASILNQSNIIGNETAALILESINKTTELNENITAKNDIQRAQIVDDVTTLLEHVDMQLDKLSSQHMNLTKGQDVIQNDTGQISGFLGGPLILNDTIDAVKAGIIMKAQNRTVK